MTIKELIDELDKYPELNEIRVFIIEEDTTYTIKKVEATEYGYYIVSNHT